MTTKTYQSTTLQLSQEMLDQINTLFGSIQQTQPRLTEEGAKAAKLYDRIAQELSYFAPASALPASLDTLLSDFGEIEPVPQQGG